ncbi:MAG: cadmium resistance transporter [Actinobacteria bacterium]|nr:cadmium resistance transporter [Actinomycetota bacterium]
MSTTTVVTRAVAAFVATNLDELVLLALLFTVRRNERGGARVQIVAGTVVGFAILVALSEGISGALRDVPAHWFALFGVVPLAVGTWALLRLALHAADEPVPILAGTGVIAVTTLTVASGGDNVSVYVALFRQLDVGAWFLTVAVFFVLLPTWCLLGAAIAGRARRRPPRARGSDRGAPGARRRRDLGPVVVARLTSAGRQRQLAAQRHLCRVVARFHLGFVDQTQDELGRPFPRVLQWRGAHVVGCDERDGQFAAVVLGAYGEPVELGYPRVALLRELDTGLVGRDQHVGDPVLLEDAFLYEPVTQRVPHECELSRLREEPRVEHTG